LVVQGGNLAFLVICDYTQITLLFLFIWILSIVSHPNEFAWCKIASKFSWDFLRCNSWVLNQDLVEMSGDAIVEFWIKIWSRLLEMQ
jgi:hypothetical protein